MAVNINTIYTRFYAILNKNQVGGSISVEEFNNYAAMANYGLMNIDFEIFQSTQKLTDRIRDFIKKKPLPINSEGQLLYPNDYFYYISLRTYDRDSYLALKAECGIDSQPTQKQYAALPQIPIKTIDNDKLGVMNQSPLFRPSNTRPFAIFYNDFIQIYPINTGVCILDYLQRPATPVFGYTLDSFGLPVYSSALSTDFEWSQNCENALLMEMLRYAGVEIRDLDIYKASAELESTGQ